MNMYARIISLLDIVDYTTITIKLCREEEREKEGMTALRDSTFPSLSLAYLWVNMFILLFIFLQTWLY